MITDAIQHLDFDPDVREKEDPPRTCDLWRSHPYDPDDFQPCGRTAAYLLTLGKKPCGHVATIYLCRGCWRGLEEDPKCTWICRHDTKCGDRYIARPAITRWEAL